MVGLFFILVPGLTSLPLLELNIIQMRYTLPRERAAGLWCHVNTVKCGVARDTLNALGERYVTLSCVAAANREFQLLIEGWGVKLGFSFLWYGLTLFPKSSFFFFFFDSRLL